VPTARIPATTSAVVSGMASTTWADEPRSSSFIVAAEGSPPSWPALGISSRGAYQATLESAYGMRVVAFQSWQLVCARSMEHRRQGGPPRGRSALPGSSQLSDISTLAGSASLIRLAGPVMHQTVRPNGKWCTTLPFHQERTFRCRRHRTGLDGFGGGSTTGAPSHAGLVLRDVVGQAGLPGWWMSTCAGDAPGYETWQQSPPSACRRPSRRLGLTTCCWVRLPVVQLRPMSRPSPRRRRLGQRRRQPARPPTSANDPWSAPTSMSLTPRRRLSGRLQALGGMLAGCIPRGVAQAHVAITSPRKPSLSDNVVAAPALRWLGRACRRKPLQAVQLCDDVCI